MARKEHTCDYCVAGFAVGRIKPGDTYYVHTAAPDHDDLGNPNWWHLKECEPCYLKRQPRSHPLSEPA